MPASRSRTERWRDCLRQVYQRDGALEISVPAPRSAASGQLASDLIWRVRILGLHDDHIVVEQPSAAGAILSFPSGTEIIAVLSIGQNRWMFRSRILEPERRQSEGTRAPSLCLQMPDSVERCQRRNFFRVSIAELSLPSVECWPLLDPASAIAAEIANRAQILELIHAPETCCSIAPPEPLILPEVGPRFHARLMNVGGGGAGLLFDPSDVGSVDRSRLFWMRINVMPQIPAPLGLTARMVHTHIDSGQNLYAGMAFDWSFHPAHRDFVVQQITRYVQVLRSSTVPTRPSAAVNA